MSTLEAILLGIIQGITEFFPVSSSGHLALGQYFLGLKDLNNYIFFNLICHLGTLAALITIFFADIKALFTTANVRLKQVILGTLPLFPLVLIMKPIKEVFSHPEYLGYCFLFTALLLYLGIRASKYQTDVSTMPKKPWRDALLIGVFQAIAILPGISRSGATISAGRLLKWQQQEAITFSFLLAIPAILGGVVLESLHLIRLDPSTTQPDIGIIQYAAGFLSSLIIGYLALCLLMKIASKNKFVYFMWYCVFIGITSIVYFI